MTEAWGRAARRAVVMFVAALAALAQPVGVSGALAFSETAESAARGLRLTAVDKAWQAHARGDIAAALATIDAAIAATDAAETEPRAILELRRTELLRTKAWLLAHNLLYADAAILFRDLSERDPAAPDYRLGLGEAEAKRGHAEALSTLQQAEHLAEVAGDDRSRRRAQIDIGDHHLDHDQRAEAAVAYDRAFALATARAAADPDDEAAQLDLIQCISRLAELAGVVGDHAEQAERLRDLLQRSQALVDRANRQSEARAALAATWSMHGDRALADGDAALALDRYERAVDLNRSVLRWSESLGDLRRLALSLRAAGVAAERLGQAETSRARHAEAAQALARLAPRVVGFPEAAARLAASARDLGRAAQQSGSLAVAHGYFAVGRDIALGAVRPGAAIDDLLSVTTDTLAGLILVLIDQGEIDAAIGAMTTMRTFWPAAEATATERRRLQATSLSWLADRALELDDLEAAQADTLAARAALDPLSRSLPEDEDVAVQRLKILAQIGRVAVRRQDEPVATAAFSSTIREADRLVALWPGNRTAAQIAGLSRLDLADIRMEGDRLAARVLAREAVDRLQLWSDGHPDDAAMVPDLATAYATLGLLETGDAMGAAFDAALRRLIAWVEQAPAEAGRLDMLVRQARTMARVQFGTGAVAEGLALTRRALALTEAQGVERMGDIAWHRALVLLRARIAEGQGLEGDDSGRLGTLESALADAEVVVESPAAGGNDHKWRVWLLDQIALTYVDWGDLGSARASRERGLAAATAAAAKAAPDDEDGLLEMGYQAIDLSELLLREGLNADALVLARYGFGLIDDADDGALDTRRAILRVRGGEALGRALLATGAQAEALAVLGRTIGLAQRRHEADRADVDRRKALIRLDELCARAGGSGLHVAAAAFLGLGLLAEGALSAAALRPYEDALTKYGQRIRAAARARAPSAK